MNARLLALITLSVIVAAAALTVVVEKKRDAV